MTNAEPEIIPPGQLVEIPNKEDGGALALQVRESRALMFFTTEGAAEFAIEAIRNEVSSFKPDTKTPKGRKAIAAMARRVVSSKTYLDDLGKELNDKQKLIPKQIDATRKKLRDELDALRDEIRQPLTDWEDKEEKRIAKHSSIISAITSAGRVIVEDTAAGLRERLAAVEETEVGKHCDEFEAQYAEAKAAAISALTKGIADAEKREAEHAELERLREEQAKRAEQEQANQVKRDAEAAAAAKVEAAAQAERDAAQAREDQLRREKEDADRRAKEAEEEAAKAKRDAAAAAEKAQRDAAEAAAEKERLAEEARKREEEAARARAADADNRAKVRAEAVAAFESGGMDNESARLAVALIVDGEIPRVTIAF